MLPAVATVGYCASQSSAYDPFRIEHARSAARKPATHAMLQRLPPVDGARRTM